MTQIRLLLDEDVWPGLATALQEAGYDAISVHEINRTGFSDEDQLIFAIATNRVVITHNIRDFASLAQQYAKQQLSHPGIIVARQFEKGALIRRTVALLSSLTVEKIQNTLRFV